MINVIARSGRLGPYIKATTQAAATDLVPTVTAVPVVKEPATPQLPQKLTAYTASQAIPTGNLLVTSGPTIKTQVRLAHTDLRVPDFTPYRHERCKDPTSKNTDVDRKTFSYVVLGTGGIGMVYAAKTVVTQFISSMSASADVLALAKIEIKLADIPEGKNVTFKWRGKPLFVRHRTQSEIKSEEAVPVSSLRDPQTDSERATRPNWLVVIGVCTHLGCVPIANAGDYGGYYCPCHGSHYDASGRIRKGPAPLNLEVPPYIFPDDGTLIVG